MGRINTEQAVEIIEAVTDAVDAATPETVVQDEASLTTAIIITVVGAVVSAVVGFLLDNWAKRKQKLWRKKK
jgi:hypothetical protein